VTPTHEHTSAGSLSDPIQQALRLPAGAEFHRCALQLNPRHYSGTYRGQPTEGTAAEHARAIVCKVAPLGVSVLAITDHNHVGGVPEFRAAAAGTDVHVFPGFELASSEGVHVLCIYPPETEQGQPYLGEFGIRDTTPSWGAPRRSARTGGATSWRRGRTSRPGSSGVSTEPRKAVNKKLRDRVEVRVTAEGDRSPVFELLRSQVGGNLAAMLDRLRDLNSLSLFCFAEACRKGADELQSAYGLTPAQARNIADNRFTTEGVVPRMREEKQRRQFLFSTHNANIPVLGDAELILGLSAQGEAEGGHAKIDPEHMGSIDSQAVRELVEDTLEGGKEAFERRRQKYGF